MSSSSIRASASAGCLSHLTARLESEDELVFVTLECDITDPQAGRRDAGSRQEQQQVGPLPVEQDELEQLDEGIRRVRPAPPPRQRRRLVEDRRREVPRLEEDRDEVAAVAVEGI